MRNRSYPLAVLFLVGITGLALAGCSDSTQSMDPAPGATAQQPSDGTLVKIQVISPDGCGSEGNWEPLIIEGALAKRDGECTQEGSAGRYVFEARLKDSGDVVVKPGSEPGAPVDQEKALKSGIVTLNYQDEGGTMAVARVSYG